MKIKQKTLWKMTQLLVLMGLIFWSGTAIAEKAVMEEKACEEVGWNVEFLGSSYDEEANVTTFNYSLAVDSAEKDLSHWVLGCIPEDGQVPIASPDEAIEFLSSKADPTTGVAGLKWDGGQDSGTTETYSISLSGFWTEGINEYSVKGGTYYCVGEIVGCGEKEVVVNRYSISGFVFQDINENSEMNIDEPALMHISVTLVDAEGHVIASVMTDENGYYIFDGLLPGSYAVFVSEETPTVTDDQNEILLPYLVFITPSELTIELGGEDSVENNFGLNLDIDSIIDDLDPSDPDMDGFVFDGTGKTIGFWKHQLTVPATGKGKAQISALTVRNYLIQVESLALAIPFDFMAAPNDYISALEILKSTSPVPVDLLSKQLLATELNHVAGMGLVSPYNALQAIIISQAEFMVKYAPIFSSAEILEMKDLCDMINNSGE